MTQIDKYTELKDIYKSGTNVNKYNSIEMSAYEQTP